MATKEEEAQQKLLRIEEELKEKADQLEELEETLEEREHQLLGLTASNDAYRKVQDLVSEIYTIYFVFKDGDVENLYDVVQSMIETRKCFGVRE